jgi:hypothetical protein
LRILKRGVEVDGVLKSLTLKVVGRTAARKENLGDETTHDR